MGAGLALGDGGLRVVALDPGHAAIHLVAEATLVLVLFADAARINLARVRRDHDLPVRMLLIGLPLAIVLGTLVAMGLFPEFSLWEAALLAALLAPTDAALGQAVLTARIVPERIRQAINIESGLNDGIALPAVLMFAALAANTHGSEDAGNWLGFILRQVTLGPLVGAAVGIVGARLLDKAEDRQAMGRKGQGIGILSLAALSYALADLSGGNGFIAAFVAGAAFGNTLRHECRYLFEFMESEGQLLMLATFLVFGAALLPEGFGDIDLRTFAYALLCLTAIRMSAVALSLIGTGLRWPTWLFLGWFGPRGLASILFVLLILETSSLPHQGEILAATVTTVALSVLLHGLSAAPLARRYGNLGAGDTDCEEARPVSALPLRDGMAPENDYESVAHKET